MRIPTGPASPRRRLLGAGGLVTAAALALVGCSSGSTPTDGSSSTAPVEARDELVVATSSLPSTFNYDGGTGSGAENEELSRNTMVALIKNVVEVNPTSGLLEQNLYEFEGELAESYEVSADGLVYTFHLRDDVLSQEGNPLDADDVLWSYERKWLAPAATNKNLNSPVITDPLAQFQKIDDLTVSVTIATAGQGHLLLSLMANNTGYIYDSDLLKEHVTAEDPYAVQWSMENANHGFGAYTVESFTPGQEMILAANPNWYGGELPIQTVTYRVVADPGTRANMVKSGDADIAQSVRPVDRADLAEAEGVKVYDFAFTNLLVSLGMLTERAPLDDQTVREAFAYAVPYQSIIDNVYMGAASRRVGFLSPTLPGYSEDSYPDYTYDPEKALELLAEAGVSTPVAFTLTVPNWLPDLEDAAVQIQSYAADAGFDVAINKVSLADYNAGGPAATFDAMLRRNYAIVQSPTYVLNLLFNPNNGHTRWVSPAYQAIIAEANAQDDALAPETVDLWLEAEALRMEEMPLAVIAAVPQLNAFLADVQGHVNRSDNAIQFSNLFIGTE
ncbi:MAG TPA: ABC transporter substrate-binding protein [Microbacteriaceae bacterium]|nr:ABC transporter substrate-binding protein [Microbacteriaceae bacterium]